MIKIESEDFAGMQCNIGEVLDIIDDITHGIGRHCDYTTLEDMNFDNKQKEYINKIFNQIYKILDYTYEDMEKRVDKYLKENNKVD